MLTGLGNIISLAFSVVVFTTVMVSEALADNADYIQSGDEALQQGRGLWLENCEGCHGYGIADAPIPMQAGDWKHRVIKEREVLYRHAIEGFIGEDYSMMPARGGNEELNDDQVKAAVDYMLFLANFYIKQQDN
ncbi:MAG: c-type cytochrome [Gammaproteobacteria bacterium]|nr:c-type cytochrome [Gammaproteobacteria bacterium]MBT8135281.1 c-type cytochrome [Gammaproteobacteria bacterium]NNJ49403.1 cytochrome c5 family protein [Gammaproteobacteria bacterium]